MVLHREFQGRISMGDIRCLNDQWLAVDLHTYRDWASHAFFPTCKLLVRLLHSLEH